MPRSKLLLLPAACLLLLAGGCGNGRGEAANHPAPAMVSATTARLQDAYGVVHEYTGTVIAPEHDDIGFELPGTLLHMNVDEGDRVSRGQVLAALDTSLLEAERHQLEAQLAENDARAKLVTANLSREQRLKRSGFAAEQHLDELRAEQQALVAAADSIRASLAANEARMVKSRLEAPYDAVVTRRYRDTGGTVVPGTPVLRLIEAAAREARVGLPARLANRLAPGAELEARVNGESRVARLIALGADIDPVTRTLTARLAVPGLDAVADGELLGLRVAEEYPGPGTWLPFAAITEGLRGLWVIYALVPVDGGGYRIEARDVEVLYAAEDRVFVRGAIADGELLVGAGLQRVAPGQTVHLAAATGGA